MNKLFNSHNNLKKESGAGFTIIELLVVVAIIAVLAAIVLVNVTGYINQGKNAAIKGNLATVLTNAAVFYDTNGDYDGFCADNYFVGPQTAITGAGGTAICKEKADNTTWCGCSTLKDVSGATGQTFCVDSTGTKTQTATACATECDTTTALCL